jgi:hypothetical protein
MRVTEPGEEGLLIRHIKREHIRADKATPDVRLIVAADNSLDEEAWEEEPWPGWNQPSAITTLMAWTK